MGWRRRFTFESVCCAKPGAVETIPQPCEVEGAVREARFSTTKSRTLGQWKGCQSSVRGRGYKASITRGRRAITYYKMLLVFRKQYL